MWAGEEFGIQPGNIAEEVARLKKQPGPGIISITGRGKLAQALMKHGLIDEYVLWIHPIVLGCGKRLFAEGTSLANLK